MSNAMPEGDGALLPPAEVRRRVEASLKRRYKAERRFRLYGVAAVITGLVFLSTLFVSIVGNGYTAFLQTYVELEIHFDADVLGLSDPFDAQQISRADYAAVIKQALRRDFPDVTNRRDRRMLYSLILGCWARRVRCG